MESISISPQKVILVSFDTLFKGYIPLITRGVEVNMCRSALAISNAINLVFLDKLPGISIREVIYRISNLLPLLIACNDYCDVGISAELRIRSGVSQGQFYSLLSLQNRLRDRMYLAEKLFLELFEDDKDYIREVIRCYIRDSTILSRARVGIEIERYREYLELDSLIFEVVCLSCISKDILVDIGIDVIRECDSYEDLVEKYRSVFTVDPRSEGMVRFIGLHAIEMILKLSDDVRRYKADEVLGLVTFRSSFDKLRRKGIENRNFRVFYKTEFRKYLEIARYNGFAPILTRIIECMFSSTQELKHILRLRNVKPLEYDNLSSLIRREDSITYDLREKLFKSGLLVDLFA